MDLQALDGFARNLLASALVGGDWLVHLEPMMTAMDALGGGPGRTVPPNLHAMPTSGIKDLFLDFKNGRSPPLTRNVSVPSMAGQGFVADHVLPNHEMRSRDPFYNEFLRPGRAHHQAAAFLDETEAGPVRLLVFRDERQGRFEAEELRSFSRCLPYLRSASMVSREAFRTMARRQAEPFDRRGESVVYLGHDGRVVDANPAADLAEDITYRVVRRRLVTMRTSEQSCLDRALTTALVEARPGMVTLNCDAGYPTMALVLPVAGIARDVFHAIAVIVVFIDPRRHQDPDGGAIGLLQGAAGLTARELDVVRLVGMGRPPQDAAVYLGMGYGTLRNHLKAAFGKLGVHTQGELVALVQRLR